MGLFSKKEAVPEIPSAPNLPELPKSDNFPKEEEKRDLPELPSFPNNSKNNDLNQEMVKSAVDDDSPEDDDDVPGIPELPKGNLFPSIKGLPVKPSITETSQKFPSSQNELEEEKEDDPEENSDESMIPSIEDTKDEVSTPPVVVQKSEKSGSDPIFVRIDKFQNSQKNFKEIKSKVSHIENVLKKIKDVKDKEEDELKGWTEDVEKIKLKLGEIDSDIFSQV